MLRSRDILGLEFGAFSLRLVEIRASMGRPVLQQIASIELEPGAPVPAAAAALRQLIRENNFTATSVAICLPDGCGFLECESNGHRQGRPKGLVDQEFIAETYTALAGGKTLTVVGRASRTDVARAADIARQAGLSVVGIQLPHEAISAALGLLDANAADNPLIGLAIQPDRMTMALSQAGTLLACQTTRRNGEESAAMDRDAWITDRAGQMLRVTQTNHPAVKPASIRITTGLDDSSAMPSVLKELGALAETVRPGASVGLRSAADWPEDAGAYAGAIGTALASMDLVARKMNFLTHLASKPEARPSVGKWTKVALAIAAVVMIATVIGGRTWIKYRQISDLRRRYAEAEPRIKQQTQVRQAWQVARPWLKAEQTGTRVAYVKILDAINQPFPGPSQAYATQFTVERTDEAKGLSIRLDGRAASNEAVNDFENRLRQSGLFKQVRRPVVTDNAQDPAYPKEYTLSMVWKGT